MVSSYMEKKHHRQTEIRRMHLDNLVLARGYRCFWCNESIISTNLVKENGLEIFNRDDHVITIRGMMPGIPTPITMTIKCATIDHVIPKVHGGSDKLFNLVACCRECNERRAVEMGCNTVSNNTQRG